MHERERNLHKYERRLYTRALLCEASAVCAFARGTQCMIRLHRGMTLVVCCIRDYFAENFHIQLMYCSKIHYHFTLNELLDYVSDSYLTMSNVLKCRTCDQRSFIISYSTLKLLMRLWGPLVERYKKRFHQRDKYAK